MSRSLPDRLMTAIVAAPDTETGTAVALRLGLAPDTVRHARQRVHRDGGWVCRLRWATCSECGGPLATAPSNRRTVHPACEWARAARKSRHQRTVGGVAPPFGPGWTPRDPTAIAAERERERQQARQRSRVQRATWTAAERAASLAKVIAWAQRTNDETSLYADAWRNPWTEDDDQFLLDHPDMKAQDAAIELGRTFHAIRARRWVLRRRGRGKEPR